MKNNERWNHCWCVLVFFLLLYPLFFFFFFLCVEDLWGALRPAGCESGNKEIDCICLRVGLSRRKQARKEGIETCAWLRVRSEPLDECEGVSPLPVCFVSAVFLFSTPRSPRRVGPRNVYFFYRRRFYTMLCRGVK